MVSIHENRSIESHNYRTAVTTGARAVNELMGLTGVGVGVAVIDSGITSFHDDLTVASSSTVYPYGNQRVTKFVDFVNGRALPYDDNGHGTHVAGIVGGNGYDSAGSTSKAGMAPKASVIALKVLDANGAGTIADIIEALNWVSVNRAAYNIRVVNLSVGAPVRESYWTDPLTLAAKKLTDQGIVVVVAAGNRGRNALGTSQYGGITAPGNAPWVLTVGASSTQGTLTRNDDIMANYSSRGPTFLDWSAKPDLVAPGTGTVSLAVPGSTFYMTKPLSLAQRGAQPFGAEGVPRAERNEHGGAGGERHGRADAPGQSEAHAESGEGDPSVHGAGVSGLRRPDAGRRLPQHAGRGAAREVLRHGRQRGSRADPVGLEPPRDLG